MIVRIQPVRRVAQGLEVPGSPVVRRRNPAEQRGQELVMKLTNIFPQIKTDKVQVKRSEGPAANGAGPARAGGQDRVDLSPGSLEVQKARDILVQTPEVRTDKVQLLREQLARGEYRVDAHGIADKMLLSLLSEHPAE